jgi:hypothetical protein
MNEIAEAPVRLKGMLRPHISISQNGSTVKITNHPKNMGPITLSFYEFFNDYCAEAFASKVELVYDLVSGTDFTAEITEKSFKLRYHGGSISLVEVKYPLKSFRSV